MEIMKATGFGWLQGYVKYMYYMHPQRLYYLGVALWWIICVMYNLTSQVAYAAGAEIVAGETIAAHMSRSFLVNNNYIGVKRMCIPIHQYTPVEGMQHVQVSSAFYCTGWHLQGWKYIPLRINQTQDFRVPDAMITNGTEALTLEFKCTIGSKFNTNNHLSYMIEHEKWADVLAVSCLQQNAYIQASTHFMDKCMQQHIQQPEVMLTLLNAYELWEDLPTQAQKKLQECMELHKQQITPQVYNTHNDAMDAHTAAGGTPATLYTAHPNTQVKQQLITQLLANMKLMGLTKQGCLLSQHKLIYPD